jgi:hypothetical protein
MTVRTENVGDAVYQAATPAETIAHEMGAAGFGDPSPTGFYNSTINYGQTWEHPIDYYTLAKYLSKLDPEDVRRIIEILEINARSLEDHIDVAYLKTSGGTVYGPTTLAGSTYILGNISIQNVPLQTFLAPTGMIIAWGASSATQPDYDAVPGYLLCDGAEYSSSEYANLYYVIGDTYGSSGAGLFNVPNLLAEYAPYNNTAGWYFIKT